VSVPRKPVDEVVEQRVTLGEKERQIVQAAVEAAAKDRDLRLALDVAQIAAMPLAIAAAGFFVYRGMNSWGTDRDKIAEWWSNATSPATGPTTGDVPGVLVGAIDGFAKFVFGPLGYVGGGQFSDGSSFGGNV